MPAEPLKMWLAVRTDLGITEGKIATQAGHAYGNLFSDAWALVPDAMREYVAGRVAGEPVRRGQPKITVRARNEGQLRRVLAEAIAAGIPAVIVEDEGHSEVPPGTPTVVAFGPARRADLPRFLDGLQVLRPPADSTPLIDAPILG